MILFTYGSRIYSFGNGGTCIIKICAQVRVAHSPFVRVFSVHIGCCYVLQVCRVKIYAYILQHCCIELVTMRLTRAAICYYSIVVARRSEVTVSGNVYYAWYAPHTPSVSGSSPKNAYKVFNRLRRQTINNFT